jgi:hypothetical protein
MIIRGAQVYCGEPGVNGRFICRPSDEFRLGLLLKAFLDYP